MFENRSRQPTPEYPVGSLVPILQHTCAPGKLGLRGRVTALNINNIPVTAACVDCRKEITVDIAALSGSKPV